MLLKKCSEGVCHLQRKGSLHINPSRRQHYTDAVHKPAVFTNTTLHNPSITTGSLRHDQEGKQWYLAK